MKRIIEAVVVIIAGAIIGKSVEKMRARIRLIAYLYKKPEDYDIPQVAWDRESPGEKPYITAENTVKVRR